MYNKINYGYPNVWDEVFKDYLSHPISIVEDDNNVVYNMIAPGYVEHYFDIFVESNKLIIDCIVGEDEELEKKHGFKLKSFKKEIKLKDNLNYEDGKLSYENGILKISFNKIKTKKITFKFNDNE